MTVQRERSRQNNEEEINSLARVRKTRRKVHYTTINRLLVNIYKTLQSSGKLLNEILGPGCSSSLPVSHQRRRSQLMRGSQSGFKFISNVSEETEVRALYRQLRLSYTKLWIVCLHRACCLNEETVVLRNFLQVGRKETLQTYTD